MSVSVNWKIVELSAKAMNSHSVIAVKQRESTRGVETCSSAHLPLYVQTDTHSPLAPQLGSAINPKNLSSDPGSVSCVSQPQLPPHIFSRSSTFCTNLYLSSSTSSENHRPLGNLPFLPHPTKCNMPVSASQSSNSGLLKSEGSEDPCDVSEQDLVDNFLNLPEDASVGSFYGENHADNTSVFTEQLEWQILSDQLDLTVTTNGEIPELDDIFEAPRISSIPTVGSDQMHKLSVQPCTLQNQHTPSTSGTTAVNKPRMRWTLELHEHFLEAVNKLDGAEKATPKAILKLMNIEGLTIFHVKSHLQKYRLAKYLPQTKDDKTSDESEERKVTSANNRTDLDTKRGMQVTEALRMQMEVQKQLHEQVEIQRALQLRIEEHARYLQKILEEQQKAFLHNSHSSATDPQSECKPRSDSPTHNDATANVKSESPVHLKRHQVDTEPGTS